MNVCCLKSCSLWDFLMAAQGRKTVHRNRQHGVTLAVKPHHPARRLLERVPGTSEHTHTHLSLAPAGEEAPEARNRLPLPGHPQVGGPQGQEPPAPSRSPSGRRPRGQEPPGSSQSLPEKGSSQNGKYLLGRNMKSLKFYVFVIVLFFPK